MTRPARDGLIHLRIGADERARWEEALRDGETLSDYLRSAADQLAGTRAGQADVEEAIEVVVRHLSEAGHELLARAVAVATDPDPPTAAELGEIALLVRQALRSPATS